MVFLHGELNVVITSAEGLAKEENYGAGFFGGLFATVTKAVNDPYVNVLVDGNKVATTRHLDDEENPEWNEFFKITVCHDMETIVFQIKDRNATGPSGKLGTVTFEAKDLLEAPDQTISGSFGVQNAERDEITGTLCLEMTYANCSERDDSGPEVPDVYFPAWAGNQVTAYQDAHNSPDLIPEVEMPDGSVYEIRGCWADIHADINAAEKFVYLTGWSFHPDIRLVRDESECQETLGELLMRKADEGVKVCIMVWDDRTSLGWGGFWGLDAGMMGTHDERMREYFEESNVECALIGRNGDKTNTIVEGQITLSCFSHHQKTVMCDAEPCPGSDLRRVVGYVGGIDLTKGRYDTAVHDLFRTREGVHKDDYINVSTGDKNGFNPREPWEDIHSKLDGPAAHQLVMNFTERWSRQGSDSQPPTPEDMGLAGPDDQVLDDPEAFSVQVLRSIDSRSCDFNQDWGQNLAKKKGRSVDNSMWMAYIHQIRRAKHFIFVENQYFLGSCYMWSEQTDSTCGHTIPAELAQKIINKIRNGERFAAYILTPLYPEGVCDSDAVQAILKFQHLTMEAMYKKIAVAIENRKEVDEEFDAVPTDYLNFYCLGNRESEEGWDRPDADEPNDDEVGYLTCMNRRFMIYVHSKLMITDDEHCIIGSANVNMRSMGGTRDSEIGAAFWQPEYLADEESTPSGKVHGFRMSVWSEHMSACEEVFKDPASLDCVNRVNEIAKENWDAFMGEENVELVGHLMPYPICVQPDGSIGPADEIVDGGEATIPDFPSASMSGQKVGLPYVLTT